MPRWKKWLLQGFSAEPEGPYEPDAPDPKHHHHTHPWWKVMCLTGVDYFSTLGYQPGIAALAAGALSPIATLVLILLTLFGALPIYRRIARESPHGEGSISMLEGLLTWWKGKLFVLALLGFVATDFIITITLSAADAAAHIRENEFIRHFVEGRAELWQIGLTLLLISLLAAVFLKGFNEAIGIAVVLVAAYLGLNVVVLARGMAETIAHPEALPAWRHALTVQSGGNPMALAMMALLVFPKLALGLSGFETGAAVMPLVKGDASDTHDVPTGRIRNTRSLLTAAALIMSVLLLCSSLVTTLQIPPREFLPQLHARRIVRAAEMSIGASLVLHPETGHEPSLSVTLPAQRHVENTDLMVDARFEDSRVPVSVHITPIEGGTRVLLEAEVSTGAANGRALAYLAYRYFGRTVGTLYDISTVLILWFAGASAMAGLLNIVPRYLPRYGMAPEWTRANRPLVLIFTAIAFFVTLLFKADVDAQGGAYATGVLVLMASAAVAVTIAAHRAGQKTNRVLFGIIAAIFVYTTTVNVLERPDGLRIASAFILAIVVVSVVSRVWRTTELRVDRITLDENAERMIAQMATGTEIRFVANKPDACDAAEYAAAERQTAWRYHFPSTERTAFVEVYVQDASTFSSNLRIEGVDVGGFWVLRCYGVAVPNAIAALLIEVQKQTGRRPHVYFNWIEANPLLFLAKFFLSGQGDVAPITHEILRQAQPDASKRPVVYAAG